MNIFDLRSDTVTLPSGEMRKAMAKAEVGDDVYGEDPTVNKLQELACKITGKRDALFIPSGSMGNLIPLFINGGRGNEVLAQKNSHILHYELASSAALAGVLPVAVEGERGILNPELLARHLRPDVYHMPRVTMIQLENTHNLEGGTCYSYDEMKDVCDFASKNNLLVHLDGARLFNAAVATGTSVKKYSSLVDTVTICLSKGLGAPVGPCSAAATSSLPRPAGSGSFSAQVCGRPVFSPPQGSMPSPVMSSGLERTTITQRKSRRSSIRLSGPRSISPGSKPTSSTSPPERLPPVR